jgi:hypothetical protein
MFLRNVGLSPNYTAFQTRRLYSFLVAEASISNPTKWINISKKQEMTQAALGDYQILPAASGDNLQRAIMG